MRADGGRRSPGPGRADVLADLRAQLSESQAALSAIRNGGVDALVVEGRTGPMVFTLRGAERPYRVLIESMNEGALMLSPHALILYANRRFARMIKSSLPRVLGRSLHEFLSDPDRKSLTRTLGHLTRPLSTIQVLLHAADGSQVPAQVSIRRLARTGSSRAAFSIVVTDMTEARRSERTLRRLSHSLLRAQETDRRRLALELHDRATQSLSALLIHLHLLAEHIPAHSKSLQGEVAAISEMANKTAEVVETISRNLRPSVLEILGLVPALRAVTAGFAKRTGLPIKLVCAEIPGRLSAESELVLYRVLEEALLNVGQHAKARTVTAHLRPQGAAVVLSIKDDGIGCIPDPDRRRRKSNGGMGLIGLRERVAYVGGTLEFKSTRGAGTEVAARIPLWTFASRGPGARRDPENPLTVLPSLTPPAARQSASGVRRGRRST